MLRRSVFHSPGSEVEANISLGPFTVRKKDSTFGLFDLVFTPIVASHHFSQTDHMACSFTFWAPTGSFETGRLVNLGLNNWTFIPGVAYTKILPQVNIELSGIWQMEFYTENPAARLALARSLPTPPSWARAI